VEKKVKKVYETDPPLSISLTARIPFNLAPSFVDHTIETGATVQSTKGARHRSCEHSLESCILCLSKTLFEDTRRGRAGGSWLEIWLERDSMIAMALEFENIHEIE
jgi:hypothetical protein